MFGVIVVFFMTIGILSLFNPGDIAAVISSYSNIAIGLFFLIVIASTLNQAYKYRDLR